MEEVGNEMETAPLREFIGITINVVVLVVSLHTQSRDPCGVCGAAV